MTDLEYIAPTKRRKMTKARAAKIFLREQGRCYLCGRKLRVSVDAYEIEHPTALSLGGSDDDADLRVVCIKCHKPKTARDAGARAKRDRLVTKGLRKKSRFPGSKDSRWKKTVSGEVIDRATGEPVGR